MKHIIQIDIDSPVMDQRKQIEAVIREWSRSDRFRHLEEVGRMLAKDQPAEPIVPQGFRDQARRRKFRIYAVIIYGLVQAFFLLVCWRIGRLLAGAEGIAIGIVAAELIINFSKLWKRFGARYSK